MKAVKSVQLARDKKAINEETERLRPLAEEGVYVRTVNHRVSADVPFDNYMYYLETEAMIL